MIDAILSSDEHCHRSDNRHLVASDLFHIASQQLKCAPTPVVPEAPPPCPLRPAPTGRGLQLQEQSDTELLPEQASLALDLVASDADALVKVEQVLLQSFPRCLESRLRPQRGQRTQRPQRMHRATPRCRWQTASDVQASQTKPQACEWCGEEEEPGHASSCRLRPVVCRYCDQKLALAAQAAHERSCPERPICDEDLKRSSSKKNGGDGLSREAKGKSMRGNPVRTGRGQSRGPSRADSRSSSQASCRSTTPSETPRRTRDRSLQRKAPIYSGQSRPSSSSIRADTSKDCTASHIQANTPRALCTVPFRKDSGTGQPSCGGLVSETPRLNAENDELCKQVLERLCEQAADCRTKLDVAMQHCLSHPQHPVLPIAAGLEPTLITMGQQLALLEWASIGSSPSVDSGSAEMTFQKPSSAEEAEKSSMVWQEKNALATLLDFQRRLDALEASLEIIQSEYLSGGDILAKYITSSPRAPSLPKQAAGVAPVSPNPSLRAAELCAVDSVRQLGTPRVPKKNVAGKALPPLETVRNPCASPLPQGGTVVNRHENPRRCSSRSSSCSSSHRNSHCSVPPSPSHNNSARAKPNSSARVRSSSRSSTRSTQKVQRSSSKALPTQSDTEQDLKAQLEAERKQYIEQRLSGHARPAKIRTGVAERVRPTAEESQALHRTIAASEEIPTIEELRLQVQRERELFLGGHVESHASKHIAGLA